MGHNRQATDYRVEHIHLYLLEQSGEYADTGRSCPPEPEPKDTASTTVPTSPCPAPRQDTATY
jgi:hypothetical protein